MPILARFARVGILSWSSLFVYFARDKIRPIPYHIRIRETFVVYNFAEGGDREDARMVGSPDPGVVARWGRIMGEKLREGDVHFFQVLG